MRSTKFDNTDLVFVFGRRNPAISTLSANHVINAKRNGAKISSGDPRKIETARIADMHIALKTARISRCSTPWGMSLLKKPVRQSVCRQPRTEGAVLKSAVRLSKAIRRSRRDHWRERTETPRRMYASAKSAAILWAWGVTQFYQGVKPAAH
ncbi:molybdopterin-dependent oxidoreductase [Salmonella enterica subsp. enterica]|nr:molybdopterin-dependent oxidoreductase [Salmonella enterica subsp. enterica]